MRYIIVTCPACRESLEIDTQSGTITRHSADLKSKGESVSLADRIKRLDEQKAKRDAMVAQSKEMEKSRQARFNKIFDQVKDKAKDETDGERPLRDFDLD